MILEIISVAEKRVPDSNIQCWATKKVGKEQSWLRGNDKVLAESLLLSSWRYLPQWRRPLPAELGQDCGWHYKHFP